MSMLEDVADVSHATGILIVVLGFYFYRFEKLILGVVIVFCNWGYFGYRKRDEERRKETRRAQRIVRAHEAYEAKTGE